MRSQQDGENCIADIEIKKQQFLANSSRNSSCQQQWKQFASCHRFAYIISSWLQTTKVHTRHSLRLAPIMPAFHQYCMWLQVYYIRWSMLYMYDIMTQQLLFLTTCACEFLTTSASHQYDCGCLGAKMVSNLFHKVSWQISIKASCRWCFVG